MGVGEDLLGGARVPRHVRTFTLIRTSWDGGMLPHKIIVAFVFLCQLCELCALRDLHL